ncbi:hypothetical protein BN440_0260 [Erwinia amylovora MR1]|nr:hypothetical protein BN440_0260 [Erwinia amylovora MR1]
MLLFGLPDKGPRLVHTISMGQQRDKTAFFISSLKLHGSAGIS